MPNGKVKSAARNVWKIWRKMIKSLKQYLSLRGLLARRLRAKKREINSLERLLKNFPKIERMMAYCRDCERLENFMIYHQKSNSGTFINFKVKFMGLSEVYITNIEQLKVLNKNSEQLKQLRAYD